MVKTRDQIAQIIRRYIAELESLGVPIECLILFGSHAIGHPHPDSDIDLAVFSERFGQDDHLEFSGILSKAKWNSDPHIEPIGFNPSSLHNPNPASFLAEIVRTGQVMYLRSTTSAHQSG